MSDQGGLRGARDAGVRTGGTAPRDWRKDDGAAPWLAEFGLVESQRKSYAARTRANAEAADGTVLFGNPLSAGSALTERCCNNLGPPLLRLPSGSGVGEEDDAARILAGWVRVHADPKSVVSGTSVSVRVASGGRRSIKTNNQ